MCSDRSSSWEHLCSKCGLCCHEKAVYGRKLVIDLDSWCEYFDPETRTCTIYAKRLTVNSRCRKMTRLRAMFASYLPSECAYVQWACARHLRFAPNRIVRLIHSRTCPPDDPDHHLCEVFLS